MEAWVRAKSVNVGFVVEKVALGQVFSLSCSVSHVNIIKPWFIMKNRPVGGRSSETLSYPHQHEQQHEEQHWSSSKKQHSTKSQKTVIFSIQFMRPSIS
jgi:hypothetical protein